MRDQFREIVDGWMIIDDFDDLTDRIERSARWAVQHGGLEPDEHATATMMVRSQVARGIQRGDFDFVLHPGQTRNDLAIALNLGALPS